MREANPCLCALRDRDGKVIEGQTGYVKVYRPEGSPPPNGYITLGYQRETLYFLCICPQCGTVAGKRQQQREAA